MKWRAGGRRHEWLVGAFLFPVALLLALGMIYYYSGVLIPIRQRQSQLTEAAPGNWSDLYPCWLGARELLLHGRNPYSAEVTQEIQRGFYGRVIDLSNPNDPKNVEAFAYPVYVVFLLAPLLPFSFEVARIVFSGVLLLVTAASVLLWMRALKLTLPGWATGLALLAAISSFAAVDGLHLQQITLLVAALMAGSMAALAGGRPALAGVLLALGTVKPQLAILVIAFLLLWTVGEWRSRKWFAIGFGASMAALLMGSEWLLPGWFRFWCEAAEAYVGYHKPSLLASLLGPRPAILVAAMVIVLCGVIFWRFRRELPGSGQFNFVLVTALALTLLLLPNAGGAYYNQVLLMPAALWLFPSGWGLAQKSGLARLMWHLVVNTLAWEWILALPVSFAALVLRHNFQREAALFVAGPELLTFLFPLVLALFVLSAAPQVWRMGEGAAHRSTRAL